MSLNRKGVSLQVVTQEGRVGFMKKRGREVVKSIKDYMLEGLYRIHTKRIVIQGENLFREVLMLAERNFIIGITI